MTARAHVEFDPRSFGLRIALAHTIDDHGVSDVYQWPTTLEVRRLDAAEAIPEGSWLSLPDEEARALYEALGDYFGHTAQDVRALRRDYDHERARVDRLIVYATTPLVVDDRRSRVTVRNNP